MIINLSQDIKNGMEVYPGDPATEIDFFAHLESDGFNLSSSNFSNHVGTHVQTPFSNDNAGKKLVEYALEDFIATGVIVDIGKYKFDPVPVEAAENLPADLSQYAVIFYSGYSEKIAEPGYFENTPVLSETLVAELLRRNTKIIGIDSHSICKQPFKQYNQFSGYNTLVVEGMVNLDKIKNGEFQFFAIPALIEAEAFPVTAFALISYN